MSSHAQSPSEALDASDTRKKEHDMLCYALMTKVVEGYVNGDEVWSPMVHGCTRDPTRCKK